MKCFIWQRTGEVTHHYHAEAGVIVFALDLALARRSFKTWQEQNNAFGVQEKCGVYLLDPDIVVNCVFGTPSRIFVFPDKGCCG